MIADEFENCSTPALLSLHQTSDGKALYVHHADYLFITPGNHTVYVFAKTKRLG